MTTGGGIIRIGGERAVRRLGFGAMHLDGAPAAARANAHAVLRRAVELGVTLIDTAHLYGWGGNEELIAEALHPYPGDLVVATKVGVAPPAADREAAVCGRPEFLRAQVDDGLRRLRMERLELLQLHRIDPGVPLADQVGTLAELRAAGKIRYLGLSEVTVDQLAEACAVTAIASVQNRYNVLDREHEEVVEACDAAGIVFLPWRPVHPAVTAAATTTGGGAAATTVDTAGAATAGGGAAAATAVGAEIGAVAAEVGATAAQVSLAWLLGRSPMVLPIPGTASLGHLAENVAAAELRLTADQWQRLDRMTSG